MQTQPLYLRQLESSFEQRSKANRSYSLRAFARDLGISVSRLSGVMNGKFGLSAAAAREIALRLRLDGSIATAFIDSAEAKHGRSRKARELAEARLKTRKENFTSLSLDQFQIISDWQHFAILELVEVLNFKAEDVLIVSKRLGIAQIEAKNAIRRLLDFDLLTVNEQGFLRATGSYVANPAGVSSDALRRHHKQLLDKAKTAVDLQTVDERMNQSLTIAISPEDLPELKKMIQEFQARVKKKANQNNKKKEVYAYTTQFFRLTEKE